MSRSESQSQSDVSFEILQSQRDSRDTGSTISENISTTVTEMNKDNDKDVNVNTGVDADDTKNGNILLLLGSIKQKLPVEEFNFVWNADSNMT